MINRFQPYVVSNNDAIVSYYFLSAFFDHYNKSTNWWCVYIMDMEKVPNSTTLRNLCDYNHMLDLKCMIETYDKDEYPDIPFNTLMNKINTICLELNWDDKERKAYDIQMKDLMSECRVGL